MHVTVEWKTSCQNVKKGDWVRERKRVKTREKKPEFTIQWTEIIKLEKWKMYGMMRNKNILLFYVYFVDLVDYNCYFNAWRWWWWWLGHRTGQQMSQTTCKHIQYTLSPYTVWCTQNWENNGWVQNNWFDTRSLTELTQQPLWELQLTNFNVSYSIHISSGDSDDLTINDAET